jgi:hypothetical protein
MQQRQEAEPLSGKPSKKGRREGEHRAATTNNALPEIWQK